ncbi:transposase, partial [bacterium]|nr:transposase [bacterium]
SRCMRHINGVYTQRFNRRHRLDGPLFRGRFKSILIGDDNYLIQLLRYICFNPVKAGIVKTPGEYPWSCYTEYLSDLPQYQWLNRDLLSGRFQFEKTKGMYKKEELVSQSADEEIEQFLEKKNLPSILGRKEFVDQIRNQFFHTMVHAEKPTVKDLALESKRIVSLVCHHFGLEQEEILQQKRGVANTPRDLAIHLIHRKSMCKQGEIAELFNFSSYSGVSTAIERIKNLLKEDSALAATVRLLENKI